jgi:hypothetical protein
MESESKPLTALMPTRRGLPRRVATNSPGKNRDLKQHAGNKIIHIHVLKGIYKREIGIRSQIPKN